MSTYIPRVGMKSGSVRVTMAAMGLAHVFTKLAVASRAELAAKAAERRSIHM